MRKTLFVSVIFYICSFTAKAQDFDMLQQYNIPVILKNDTLRNAWAGGINSSLISTYDFDRDGTEDIVLFDRDTHRPLVFLLKNNRYTLSGHYSSLLPALSRYAIFTDYDKDGKKDLFTSSQSGIRVYHNTSQGADPSFRLIKDPLLTNYGNTVSNMDLSQFDLPSFTDVDSDGDMDILHFRSSSGTSLDFEKNMSMETYGRPDSLIFKNTDNCWGGFMETSCHTYNIGFDCKINFRLEHAGSGAVCAFDINNDQDKEVLIGKEDCTNLAYLENTGNKTNAIFKKALPLYPQENPVRNIAFPLPITEDVDGDGKKDLLVTSGQLLPDDTLDAAKTIRQFKNTGTSLLPQFTYQTSDFLQNTMIDLGKNSCPTLIDLDGDGDLDLLAASGANNKQSATLTSFINTGTSFNPVFTRFDTNFQYLKEANFSALLVSSGDLNNDNKTDLIYCVKVNNQIRTFWSEYNQSHDFSDAPLKPLNIQLTQLSSLTVFDVTKDGYNDILAGSEDGALALFAGSSSGLAFTLIQSDYGGFAANSNTQINHLSSAVIHADNNTQPDLLILNDLGFFKVIPDFQTQDPLDFAGNEVPMAAANPLPLGKKLFITTGDLTMDGSPEIICGNQNGGLMLFQTRQTVAGFSKNMPEVPLPKIYPNPSSANLKIENAARFHLKITDISGHMIWESRFENLPETGLHVLPGIYFLSSVTENGLSGCQKLIIR